MSDQQHLQHTPHTTDARVALGFYGTDIPQADNLHACIHCALCLSSCPTYRETGVEPSSPRGRIYLMRGVKEGRIGLNSAVFQEQMAQCLNCRACEAVCPSGVRYGVMLEACRAQIEQGRELAEVMSIGVAPDELLPRPWWQRVLRWVVFRRLFADMTWFRRFSGLLALYQRSGIQRLVRAIPLLKKFGMGDLNDLEALLPPMSRPFTTPQGQVYPAIGERRYTVALLTGCIMSTAFAHVHEATIRVLQHNGCEVVLPPHQGCCGALHVHSGDLEGGRALARHNIAAFRAAAGEGQSRPFDAIIVNAAGCGSTLKEYGELLADDPEWHDEAVAFAQQVQDIHEFLCAIEINRATLGSLPHTVTYQDACHLAHAQRIRVQPRDLLRAIPGLEVREMQESAVCCGSAGVYNITQPEMAQRLGQRKIRHALATGATIIATTNPGCAVQMAGELRKQGQAVEVRYVVELLDEAYQAYRRG